MMNGNNYTSYNNTAADYADMQHGDTTNSAFGKYNQGQNIENEIRHYQSLNDNYRGIQSIPITHDTARTVSRPELVVKGLKEMCNLVQDAEPENPTSSFNIRSRTSSYRLAQEDTPQLTSPPIPPPTAFDARRILATEEITLSNLALSMDPPEAERQVFRGHRRRKIITSSSSPRRQSLNRLPSPPPSPVDDAKICQVLHRMITRMEDYDRYDVVQEVEKEDYYGGCGEGQSMSKASGVRGTVSSSVQSQKLNAVSSHRSLPVESTRAECLRYLKDHNQEEHCPQYPISYPKVINQTPATKPRARNFNNLSRSFFRDGIEYHYQNQPGSTPKKKVQQQKRASKCRLNSDSDSSTQSDLCHHHSSQERKEKCVKNTRSKGMNSKSTSTSDVLTSRSTCTYSMVHQPIISADVPSEEGEGGGDPQEQQQQQTSCPMTGRNSGIIPGDGQPVVPIYIVQTTPNQQMPIFLVHQGRGGNPGGEGIIMGQQPQVPIFLHQVQQYQQPQPQFHQQDQTNLNQEPEEQIEQSQDTVKATRVETRTFVPAQEYPQHPEHHSGYEENNTKQNVKSAITKALQKIKSGQAQLQKLQSKPFQFAEEDENNYDDEDSSDRTESYEFIVGPPPPPVVEESRYEIETLHNRQQPMQRLASNSRPRPLHHRKKESYSDSEINKAMMAHKRNIQTIKDEIAKDIEDRYKAKNGQDDKHCDLLAATPTTSSHTVTIDTNPRHGRENDQLPCISSQDDDDDDDDQDQEHQRNRQEQEHEHRREDEESYYDPDCSLSSNSNSSLMEPEPRHPRVRNHVDNKHHRSKQCAEVVEEKKHHHHHHSNRHHHHKDVEAVNKQVQDRYAEKLKDKEEKQKELEIIEEDLEILDENLQKVDNESCLSQQNNAVEAAKLMETSLPGGLFLLEDRNSWQKNIAGLKVISFHVRFQNVEAVLERLPCITPTIHRHIKGAGTKLARQAILTLRDLFNELGPHFDPFLSNSADSLFAKMTNTSKFLRSDCESALEAMVDNCSQPKTLSILESTARRHKHDVVRLVAGRMITRFISGVVGPSSALEDYAETVIPLLCCNLGDRSHEIREEAKTGLRLLVPHPDFDAYMRHTVSPQFILSISEKLERIREEVSDRPPIRKKLSRNRSLFNSQQKFSNSNFLM